MTDKRRSGPVKEDIPQPGNKVEPPNPTQTNPNKSGKPGPNMTDKRSSAPVKEDIPKPGNKVEPPKPTQTNPNSSGKPGPNMTDKRSSGPVKEDIPKPGNKVEPPKPTQTNPNNSGKPGPNMTDKRSSGPVKEDIPKPGNKVEPPKPTQTNPNSSGKPGPNMTDKSSGPVKEDIPKPGNKVEPVKVDIPKPGSKVEPVKVDTLKPDNKVEPVRVDPPKATETNPSNYGKPGPSTAVDADVTNAATVEPVRSVVVVKTPCVNIYQQKKTLAQGMMDFALLLANARQLKDVLEQKAAINYFAFCLTLILISIALQIVVGGMLIWNSRFDIKDHFEMVRANRVNNFTITSIFAITVTNVFISVFDEMDHSGIQNL